MAWWTWGPLTGALVRRVPASVINVSTRGCLIQTSAPLTPGAVGLLAVETSDAAQGEPIRICHSVERPGSPLPFCAGTEFLVLDAASPRSVREQAARFERGSRPGKLVRTGENSGTAETRAKPASTLVRQEVSEIVCDADKS